MVSLSMAFGQRHIEPTSKEGRRSVFTFFADAAHFLEPFPMAIGTVRESPFPYAKTGNV
jgi:hypothetical protein